MSPLYAVAFSDYQREAARTLARPPDEVGPVGQLAVFALGLAGESGEVIELVKKHVGHGHDLDRAKLRKELGDVLWYLAGICTLNGLDLGDVAGANIDKLRARYPEGFSAEASKARGDL